MLKKFAAVATLLTLLAFGGLQYEPAQVAAQTLSDQVLLLLGRTNTWTADQTFDNVTITGTCTGCGGAGGGTVTSVAASVDTELDTIVSLSGSPITGSGTLAFTLDSQTDHTFLAGATSGGPTDPTFRAIVDDDIPDSITISGTNNVTWASVNKTGSSLADLATRSAGDLSSGSLALARLTDGGTAGVPLVAGGGGGDPNYAAIDIGDGTSVTGTLLEAQFPALDGDITTSAADFTTELSNTGVTAATYGSSSAVGQFTVDEDGRITSASDVTIATANLLSTTYCADCAADAATRGSLLIANSSNLWDEVTIGSSGTALFSDGTDAAWGTDGTGLNIDVDNATAGTLAIARGGSNKALTLAAGAVLYTDANSFEVTAVGSTGECLISQGTSAPIWDTCATAASHALLSATHSDTSAATVSRGSLVYGNSSPAWAELTIGSAGTVLRSDGTDLSWSSDGSGLTLLNASELASGTVPLGRLSGITNTQISASAAIAWSKIDTTGASLSDLGDVEVDADETFDFLTRSKISSPADGVLLLTDDAGTDWTRIAFGGTTTSYPALERSGTGLSLVRGDGTGGAMLGYGSQAVDINGVTTFAVTSSYVVLTCDGAETINTITGGLSGMRLVILHADTDCTIADDDDATASDAIDLTGTATNDVGAVAKVITLLYNGSHWLQVAESDN